MDRGRAHPSPGAGDRGGPERSSGAGPGPAGWVRHAGGSWFTLSRGPETRDPGWDTPSSAIARLSRREHGRRPPPTGILAGPLTNRSHRAGRDQTWARDEPGPAARMGPERRTIQSVALLAALSTAWTVTRTKS